MIPAHETDFAASVAGYADELHKLSENMRGKTRELNKLLDDDAYKLAANPDKPRAAPPRADEVPFLNFSELDNAAQKLEQSAKAFDKEYARFDASNDAALNGERERVNSTLSILEQSLTDPRGLPGRDWYQHIRSMRRARIPGTASRPCREFAKQSKSAAGRKPTNT